MGKTFKLFSLLFLLIFSLTFALSDIVVDESLYQYRLYVTKVDPESRCFALSNGVVCNLVEKRWKFERLPDVGTEIYLTSRIRFSRDDEERIREGEFTAFFSIGNTKRFLSVWVPPEYRHSSLSYVTTKLERTQPARWWSAEVHQNVIELSDGSKWITDKDFAPLFFNPGDSVVLTRDMKSDQWSIINISEEYFSETSRSSLAFYQQMEVKPYLVGEIPKRMEFKPYLVGEIPEEQ